MRKLRFLVNTVPLCTSLTLGAGCFNPETGSTLYKRPDAVTCLTPEEADRLADQVLQLVNLERAERDMQPVVVNSRLSKMADDYACEMVNGKFFGHRHPQTGQGPADRAVTAKYAFYAIGENLAAGSADPAEVMQQWMESPSHRNIILDPTWKEVGIAVRSGGEMDVYWVQEFGDPAGL